MRTRNIKIRILKALLSRELRDLKRDNRRIASKLKRIEK